MKNNLDYYQHDADSDSHPKFKMLRVEFGWAGDGMFWALNNRIAKSENCCIDLNKKYIKASLASDLGLSLDEFERFIQHILVECELIKEINPGVITTDRIQETFAQVQANREKARERKQRNLEKVSKCSGEKEESSGEPNKRSKVKETKLYSDKLKTFVRRYIEYISKTFPTKSPKGKDIESKSLDTMNKLTSIDGFKEDYVFSVLRWSKDDEFWKHQVFSLAALRNKSHNGLTKFQNISIAHEKENPQEEDLTEDQILEKYGVS
jgi:hypothetical protein